MRDRLIKELPDDESKAGREARELANRAKELIISLARISTELAQLVVAETESGAALPGWYTVELAVEDTAICDRLDIAVAAVSSEERQIYINPKFPWTYEGMQFVMAHELLHVGLRHEQRRQGRDPFLWNVACDYVINGWLVEMGVGAIPTDDLLLDPELGFERESAEAIYDRIVKDLRLMRRRAPCAASARPISWGNAHRAGGLGRAAISTPSIGAH